MTNRIPLLILAVAMPLTALAATNAEPPAGSTNATPIRWLAWPDARFETRGLSWLAENNPELWRLPKSAKDRVPKGVWNRAVAPDGGRVRLSCNSSALSIRVQGAQAHSRPCFFDAFVDGQYLRSANAAGTQQVDLVIFEKRGREWKDVTLYLPHNQAARLLAIGVDSATEFKAPPAFARKLPLVCYGSSVLQGTGAAHPSKTYPAVTAAKLNLDFVNLGFGGAGKAEPEVVALVNQLDACCYLFDLGKSYGAPTPERFNRMLDTIRASHPKTPIFCVTPIYSTKEETDAAYQKRSEDLRALMREAAMKRQQAGDKQMFVVEGLELFGPADRELFHDPAHPNDAGNERIAQRLAPVIEKALRAE